VSREKKTPERKTKKRSELAEKLNSVLREKYLMLAGERLGVAVSGGADSVALLRLLLELRAKCGFVLAVVHFNHQLRGKASTADEHFVESLARKHGIEFFVGREDIAARTTRQRGNLEDVARRARYAFFEKLQKQHVVSRVAVAHTADDQAETVLAHVLRGTGLSGLRGIHPQMDAVFRPLLSTRRAELRHYLMALKQTWREDATNRDTKRTRSRIRHKFLPLLEKDFNTGVVEHLCQLAELAAEDEDFLESRAAEWLRALTRQKKDDVSLALADLLQTPMALRTRIVREVVTRLKTRGGQLNKEHVAMVLELATRRASGKSIRLPGGVNVQRERELLRFRAIPGKADVGKKNETQEYAYPIELRGGATQLRVVELSCLLHLREIDWPAEGRETSNQEAYLDRDRLRDPLVLRNWRPGDVMRPKGHHKAHKLARLLNEKSVSRWDKANWPVLTCGGKLAWARGLAESAEFAAGPETLKALLIIEEPYCEHGG
jgi:tRNA(Ile)-lysidine synthase